VACLQRNVVANSVYCRKCQY